MDKQYILHLIGLGFSEKQAKTIEEGRTVDALTDEEFLTFSLAWDNDNVEQMKPLVEEYGWNGLVKRMENSIERNEETTY